MKNANFHPRSCGFGAIESLVMLALLATFTWVLLALALGNREAAETVPQASESAAHDD